MKNVNILIENGVNVNQGIELLGDMEMYNELLNDFLNEIKDKFNQINQFKEQSDMVNYAVLVHSLKSDAKYLGFNQLAELAYKHELESKANNISFVNENYYALEYETKRIVAVVTKYLGENNLEAPATPAVEAKPEISNITILVVDDSDIIQNFIKKIFVENFDVILASDGAEAIGILETHHNISAMLLDLNMPNINGFKVLEYMKEKDLFKTLPVSIITGNESKDTDLKAFGFPIVDILKKPFNETSLRNIIERTLGYK